PLEVDGGVPVAPPDGEEDREAGGRLRVVRREPERGQELGEGQIPVSVRGRGDGEIHARGGEIEPDPGRVLEPRQRLRVASLLPERLRARRRIVDRELPGHVVVALGAAGEERRALRPLLLARGRNGRRRSPPVAG